MKEIHKNIDGIFFIKTSCLISHLQNEIISIDMVKSIVTPTVPKIMSGSHG